MIYSRQTQIEIFAGDGDITLLKKLFESGYTQLEMDTALENAIAYSKIETAEYLISIGANFSNYGYNGIISAVHNNELEGLKFAIGKGVNINQENGIFLNESIITAVNSKSVDIVKWILDNGSNPKLLTNKSHQLVNKYSTQELKSLIENTL